MRPDLSPGTSVTRRGGELANPRSHVHVLHSRRQLRLDSDRVEWEADRLFRAAHVNSEH